MAKNKIQFQKGLSMSEFMKIYGTEDQCFFRARENEVACWFCVS